MDASEATIVGYNEKSRNTTTPAILNAGRKGVWYATGKDEARGRVVK
jgi:hypothetical protein